MAASSITLWKLRDNRVSDLISKCALRKFVPNPLSEVEEREPNPRKPRLGTFRGALEYHKEGKKKKMSQARQCVQSRIY